MWTQAPGRGARPPTKPEGGDPSFTASLGAPSPAGWEATGDRPNDAQRVNFPSNPLKHIPAISKGEPGEGPQAFKKPVRRKTPAARVEPPKPVPPTHAATESEPGCSLRRPQPSRPRSTALHSPGEELALDPEQQAGRARRVRLPAARSRRRGGLHGSPAVSGARNP